MSANRRYGLVIAVAAAVLGVACLLATCVAPRSFKAAKQPRQGQALGGRLAVVFSERYQIDLPGVQWFHPFDTRKYAKIYLRLNTEGFLRPETVFVPPEATPAQIRRVHTESYLASLKSPRAVARYLEAPILASLPASVVDSGVLRPHRYATGGTILAARLAMKSGVAINLAGGFHHAKPDSGEGFCVYNDIAIAIRTLQDEGRIGRALVVDLDVHQGNGTAECFAGEESVFTFSMHQRNIYPIPKSQSDLDIELDAGTDDATFLAILRKNLPRVLERSRPDIVFLQAGCDTLKGDPLAGLMMTQEGIVQRDALVIDECVRRRIPVVMTLGGGYTRRSWAVQYASIRRTIETHGLSDRRPHPRRKATVKEKLYTK